MHSYIISVNGNNLFLSRSDLPSEVTSTKLSKDIVEDSVILSAPLFSEKLGELILETYGQKAEKLPFTFLVEPEDVHLSFITTTQKEKNDDTALVHEVSKKLAAKALTLDDVYFSYQKIAPFVYQLVAVKKDILEKYVEISNNLGFELKAVVPWVLVLPKTFNEDGSPSIFLVDNNSTKSLVLAELGGIYHIGNLEDGKNETVITDLVRELSVYQRKDPIKKIFTFNIKDLNLGGTYEVEKIEYESLHELYSNSFDSDIYDKQMNLLNLFPVPSVQKNNSLVYVASAIAVAILIGGFVYLKPFNLSNASDQITQGNDNVLSESLEVVDEVIDSTDQTQEEDNTKETAEDILEEEVDLNKSYVTIRIENGTNISGLAGQTQTHLAPFGYEILSIGDSETDGVEVTKVEIAEEYEIYADLIEEDLLELYDQVEISTLPEGDFPYAVLITAGSNLK